MEYSETEIRVSKRTKSKVWTSKM